VKRIRLFAGGVRTFCAVISCAAFAALMASAALAASNVIELTYDAAGNIKNIARQAAAGFAITSFDPCAANHLMRVRMGA
jgi:hypothetical protein